MYELRALCTSHKCGRHEFHMLRRNVVRKSTSGQPYTISRVVCPKCSMWADIQEIKEVSNDEGKRSGGRTETSARAARRP